MYTVDAHGYIFFQMQLSATQFIVIAKFSISPWVCVSGYNRTHLLEEEAQVEVVAAIVVGFEGEL